MPLLSFGLGARIIEKHFTLNRTLKGTDHAFSLEPVGMRKLARDLDRAFLALGDGEKVIYPEEERPIQKMSKMIVSKDDLPSGHKLNIEDFEYKSPCKGLSPNNVSLLLGQTLIRPVKKGSPFSVDDIEKPILGV
jgi:N-acetylneuraminate synthase/sialic acid synthase